VNGPDKKMGSWELKKVGRKNGENPNLGTWEGEK
jgi:hypothetical protein